MGGHANRHVGYRKDRKEYRLDDGRFTEYAKDEFKPKLHELVPELANLTDEDLEELTDRNRDYDN